MAEVARLAVYKVIQAAAAEAAVDARARLAGSSPISLLHRIALVLLYLVCCLISLLMFTLLFLSLFCSSMCW